MDDLGVITPIFGNTHLDMYFTPKLDVAKSQLLVGAMVCDDSIF